MVRSQNAMTARCILGALALAVTLPAGGAAAETSTQRDLEGTILGPAFDLSRIQCMDGTAAKIRADVARKYPDKEPVNTGEYCLGLMAHSADTERNASALRERPDKALLAPYKNIALDKGFRPTEANAAKVLDIFAQVAQQRNANTIGPGRVPMPNGQALDVLPGIALDAGFTSTMRSAASQPAPTRSRAEIIAVAGKCVTNTQETIAACYRAGVEFARLYLTGRGQAAPR